MGVADDLQFEVAEPAGPAVCAVCKQPLTRYFDLRGHRICASCCTELARRRPGTPAQRFWRATGLGAAAAAAGSLLYLAIFWVTGYELGLVAVAVGIGVGVAVRKGSHAMGGAGYQALAIALTYLSISAAYYVVIAGTIDPDVGAAGYLVLVPLSLAVPFFGLASGNILGVIIVGFGLYEAWKINRRPQLAVTGPFQVDAG